MVKKTKSFIRKYVWDLLEKNNIVLFPRPVYHRIPNFVGADKAATMLASLDVFRNAKVVKVNPDAPQKHVRYLALAQNKIVVMPTPRIRSGFVVLDPSRIPRDKLHEASTIAGAYRYGVVTKPWNLPRIDLIVIGSVAVNVKGARLGKGEGYAELEYGILRTVCKISENTPIATTVHDLQVIEMDIPVEPFDLGVDIIVTPTRIIRVVPRPLKPSGVLWDLLPEHKLREIPILNELRRFLRNEKNISCA